MQPKPVLRKNLRRTESARFSVQNGRLLRRQIQRRPGCDFFRRPSQLFAAPVRAHVLNHSFMRPGLVATISSVVIGFVMAKIVL